MTRIITFLFLLSALLSCEPTNHEEIVRELLKEEYPCLSISKDISPHRQIWPDEDFDLEEFVWHISVNDNSEMIISVNYIRQEKRIAWSDVERRVELKDSLNVSEFSCENIFYEYTVPKEDKWNRSKMHFKRGKLYYKYVHGGLSPCEDDYFAENEEELKKSGLNEFPKEIDCDEAERESIESDDIEVEIVE